GAHEGGEGRRLVDGARWHWGGGGCNPADHQRRIEAEPVAKDLAPAALFALALGWADGFLDRHRCGTVAVSSPCRLSGARWCAGKRPEYIAAAPWVSVDGLSTP